jgi:hypothetical protein
LIFFSTNTQTNNRQQIKVADKANKQFETSVAIFIDEGAVVWILVKGIYDIFFEDIQQKCLEHSHRLGAHPWLAYTESPDRLYCSILFFDLKQLSSYRPDQT